MVEQGNRRRMEASGSAIRYHALWVRVLCCVAVSVGVGNALYFGALAGLERALVEILSGGTGDPYAHVSARTEYALVFACCVLPSLPRLERPIAMISLGGTVVAVYVFAAMGLLLTRELLLPLAAPILGVMGSTAMLETMAWSEERYRRRRLEDLECARQQFADMLVHDLKKRLSSILMSMAALRERAADADRDTATMLVAMQAAAERMSVLVSGLLDTRKMQEVGLPLRSETLSLAALSEACVGEHRAAAELMGVTWRFRLAGECRVRGDREILLRILTNLIWNAMQHAPRGDVLEMEGGVEPGGWVELTVSNAGPAIPPDVLGRLFTPFAAQGPNATDGTGIGLAFCKLAVEAHGGTIALSSPRPGHDDGVSVRVRLPAAARHP